MEDHIDGKQLGQSSISHLRYLKKTYPESKRFEEKIFCNNVSRLIPIIDWMYDIVVRVS